MSNVKNRQTGVIQLLYHTGFFMSFYAITALVNAVTSLILGSLLITKNTRSRLFITFSLFSYSVAFWSFFYFLWQIADTSSESLLYIRVFMSIAVFIPFFYFHFVTIFTKQEEEHRISIIVGYILAVAFSFLSYTSLFIVDVTEKMHFEFWPNPGVLFLPFLAIWLIYILYGLTILLRELFRTNGAYHKQIKILFIGMIIGYLGGLTNYFLWYDIEIPPFGNIFVTFYVLAVAYAVVRHHLFNFKILIAEFSIFILWILSFIRVATSSTQSEYWINSIYLTAILIIGTFLILNIQKQARSTEEIEMLAKSLARANRRLQALDKQKSEFVSIASHQLRSPLTAIRGYASMLLEGSFGKFPAKARTPLSHIEESARMMAMSIEDYLSVSRIESGNMKYDYSDFNLKDIAEQITDDLRAEATKQGLLLLFKSDVDSRCIVHADKGKVQQIMHNLINNALKYTPKGSITVFVHDDTKQNTVHVEIIDTGIGMSEKTISGLFQKFQRSEDANLINVHGTGLGLYVAQKMATEMKGDITAHSEGSGKGSHFILHLPIRM